MRVYDWSRFNSLPRGYDWISEEIGKDLNRGMELVTTTVRYGNQATARRIGYLLDSLLQDPRMLAPLQSRLSNSKALIPWVPGRPAKGTINRTWGVIVNG
jgi:predicted transcriptional regulator of viral defense system